MRPIDLLGIELCDHCQPICDDFIRKAGKSLGVIDRYQCTKQAVMLASDGQPYRHATSDPCTMIDWRQCRLNPANEHKEGKDV